MEQPPSMKQNEDSNYTSKDDTSNDEFNQQFSNENKENNSQNNTQSDGTTNNQPPEKPSGEDDKTFPNQSGENAPEINSLNSTNISNIYFILFVIQILVNEHKFTSSNYLESLKEILEELYSLCKNYSESVEVSSSANVPKSLIKFYY